MATSILHPKPAPNQKTKKPDFRSADPRAGGFLAEMQSIAARLVAEEILRNQLANLADVTTQMVLLAETLPAGDLRY